MTNPNIVVVNSAIQQTGVDAGDYKTQLVLDTYFDTFDRVSTFAPQGYNNIKSGTSLRRALDAVFSPQIVPSIVKVGRTKGTAVYTPDNVATGSSYGFTITVLDGFSQAEAYTTGVGEDAEDVANGLKAQFDIVTDITSHVTLTVVGVGVDAVLQVSLVSSADDFTLTSFTGDYLISGITTEVVADSIRDVHDIDEDWSWITSTNHEPAYQASLMALTQTLTKKKYQTSSQLEENYGNWDEVSVPVANSVVHTAAFRGYDRTNVFYHHEADTLFPEMRRVTQFALLEPGRSDFQDKPMIGVPLAMIADGSRKLRVSELLELKKGYATTTVRQGGAVRVNGMDGSGNRMANGTRIETIYWTDRAAQVIVQRIAILKANTNKLGLNDGDIARAMGVVESWLDTQVSVIGSTYALDPLQPFKLTYPKASDITFEDKVAGLLQGIKVVAYSDASIDKVVADLTVTFFDPSQEG